MKFNFFSILAVLLVLFVGVFYVLQTENQDGAMPSTIHVGVLPDESKQALQARFESLLSYLSAETGLEFRLIESSDYDELVDLFISDEVDLAYFGGYTFVQANALHGAIPLVMREIDTRFTSYFLAPANAPGQRLEDFRDKIFSFGNRLSTSGHLMPRYFLQQDRHMVPEEFFSEVRFSGAHDKTAYLVRDGGVDLGVANSAIIRAMFKDGRLKEEDLRIVWETPPFPDYVWAAQSRLHEGVRTRIRDAFLRLEHDDDRESDVLDSLGARLFLPAAMSDFEALQEVAQSMQLLSPEIQ